MRSAAGVVFLTALPLAVLLMAAGAADRRPAEVLAGLLVAAIVGVPPVVAGFRARRPPSG
jgi:hypothetical protein